MEELSKHSLEELQEIFKYHNIKIKKPKIKKSKDSIIQEDVKKKVDKFAHVRAKVDTDPLPYNPLPMFKKLFQTCRNNTKYTLNRNIDILKIIRNSQMQGKVDCYWDIPPLPNKRYYLRRLDRTRAIERENQAIYDLLINANSKVPSNKQLKHEWRRIKDNLVLTSKRPFILFPIEYYEEPVDDVFRPKEGFRRERIFISLKNDKNVKLGDLQIEMFDDVCPKTCLLFRELMAGDGLGHGYVGTQFFIKVPNLYWSGGDVIHDNGFGCYAQKGRVVPIVRENYHFRHTVPGLLSMRVAYDNLVCGIFVITFKPLPQFDDKYIVFGRVVLPNYTFECMKSVDLNTRVKQKIVISDARVRQKDTWVHGEPNKVISKNFVK